jgi:ubiquinone/menaquinone biosynthesis C-methylase UbiE
MGYEPTAASVARIYDRLARVYDFVEAPMDFMGGRRRRRRVLQEARGRVLEVGIGTGRNLDYYPAGVELTAIDISPEMLARARRRAQELGREVSLELADVEALPFPDGAFDTVTAACVFCSVADPVAGLREVRRVVSPAGRVLLLEHVRPRNPVLGKLFDLLTPLTRRLLGPEINRRTEENLRASGLEITHVHRDGIWREIVARRSARGAGRVDAGGRSEPNQMR